MSDVAYPLLMYVDSIGSQLDITEQYTRDSPTHTGWGSLLDVNACPAFALPWLAQFVGVQLSAGASVDQQRAQIIAEASFSRGTLAHIQAAVAPLLQGDQVLNIIERWNGPYTVRVYTSNTDAPGGAEGQVPQAVLAALQAQLPAGLVLSYFVLSGPTWAGIEGTWAQQTETWAQLANETLVT